MTPAQAKFAERRFRELAAKEALGTITPQEALKLDRYQELRRSLYSVPIPRESLVNEWRIRQSMKELRRLLYAPFR